MPASKKTTEPIELSSAHRVPACGTHATHSWVPLSSEVSRCKRCRLVRIEDDRKVEYYRPITRGK